MSPALISIFLKPSLRLDLIISSREKSQFFVLCAPKFQEFVPPDKKEFMNNTTRLFLTVEQCCGAGSGRIRVFWSVPNPAFQIQIRRVGLIPV